MRDVRAGPVRQGDHRCTDASGSPERLPEVPVGARQRALEGGRTSPGDLPRLRSRPPPRTLSPPGDGRGGWSAGLHPHRTRVWGVRRALRLPPPAERRDAGQDRLPGHRRDGEGWLVELPEPLSARQHPDLGYEGDAMHRLHRGRTRRPRPNWRADRHLPQGSRG